MAIRTNYNAENKQTQATEQQSERSDGSDESESELLKEVKPRAWRETSGPKIGTFIGVLLLQGICKLPRTENYWNTREDLNVNLPIHSAMSLVRWQQIKRYLKISDPRSEKDSKAPIGMQKWSLSTMTFSRSVNDTIYQVEMFPLMNNRSCSKVDRDIQCSFFQNESGKDLKSTVYAMITTRLTSCLVHALQKSAV